VLDGADIEDLVKLFNISKKGVLEKYCRTLAIRQLDFVAFILCAKTGGLEHYRYASRFFDRRMPHLTPTPDELAALAHNGIGPLQGKARKAVTKVGQFLVDRRQFAAHLFYTPDYEHWHLLYFDQRDTVEVGNRWKHGAHIHYVSSLWSNLALPAIWQQAQTGNMNVKAVHIRYHVRDEAAQAASPQNR
jgi:hypothetical protein